MPYKVEKVKGGFKAVTKDTGNTHSNKPLTKAKAEAQVKALYANTKEKGLKKKK